ncbi:CPBP family intramembrane metalloprotease [Neobacillus piezotolerans]|uniref:CPBP family intramembrane metalloprotease n=1 Tax=Neobacillus piezotolerans TaxID=2259171 RepID=A0A3D8GVC5_9BACI|nr:type II CAAX endopeptidase family protein [Neobacillus piezotolerans]RDU38385.1 CPBP family intramembrane metalloprotease [Neobacillus piezotolerans]
MVSEKIDYRLIGGFLLAHILLYFTFQDKNIFWYIFPASLLVLTIWTILHEDVDDRISFIRYISAGILSGLLLYGLFHLGNSLIHLFHLPLGDNIGRLYKWFAPEQFWQYIALVLIAVPGEELFWRGFIQKRILKRFPSFWSIVISAAMYASVHLYSSEMILVFAAFVSGIVWGLLFAWKRSIPLVIVSHLVFDLLLFILAPLY